MVLIALILRMRVLLSAIFGYSFLTKNLFTDYLFLYIYNQIIDIAINNLPDYAIIKR